VFSCRTAGPYHDTWGTKDFVTRDNYFSDVLVGPLQSITGHSDLKPGTLSLAGTTATFTTMQPHGLVVGQGVQISPQLGVPPQSFFAVTAVPSSTSFTFEVSGNPPLSPPYSFGAMWQVDLAVFENNVIELIEAYHPNTTYGYSSGLGFYSQPHDTQYRFRRLVVRRNVINVIPGPLGSLARAIELQNVENALVEHNVTNATYQAPLTANLSKPLHFHNNHKPSGALIEPLMISPTDEIADDLRTRVEDALTLAL